MFCFFIFLQFILGQVKTQNPEEYSFGRIVGGTTADISEVPYTVSLNIFSMHTCGGSIIAPKVVLSAAHCFRTPGFQPTTVVFGTSSSWSGGKTINIARYVLHPEFKMQKMDFGNDISIVFLNDPIEFGPNAFPVRLPRQDEPVPEGQMLIASGWGLTNEKGSTPILLHKVALPAISGDTCKRFYSDFDQVRITKTMFCAGYKEGGKDACQGDSGGPLVLEGVLIGITSWGEGCARPEKPGVYTWVAHFRNWIDSVVKSA